MAIMMIASGIKPQDVGKLFANLYGTVQLVVEAGSGARHLHYPGTQQHLPSLVAMTL